METSQSVSGQGHKEDNNYVDVKIRLPTSIRLPFISRQAILKRLCWPMQ